MRPLIKSALAAAFFSVVLAFGGMANEAAGKDTSPAPGTAPPLQSLFGGPFDLVDHNGARRTDRDYRGRFLLIYFGYTFCPTICPTNLQHMAEAMDLLGEDAAKVQPLFITIDPARDTPALLKDYVASFGPRFTGLSGSETETRKVAKAFRVHRRKVRQDGNNDYLVDHSSITYLMGPDGTFATLFPYDTNGETMARRIRDYLAKAPGN